MNPADLQRYRHGNVNDSFNSGNRDASDQGASHADRSQIRHDSNPAQYLNNHIGHQAAPWQHMICEPQVPPQYQSIHKEGGYTAYPGGRYGSAPTQPVAKGKNILCLIDPKTNRNISDELKAEKMAGTNNALKAQEIDEPVKVEETGKKLETPKAPIPLEGIREDIREQFFSSVARAFGTTEKENPKKIENPKINPDFDSSQEKKMQDGITLEDFKLSELEKIKEQTSQKRKELIAEKEKQLQLQKERNLIDIHPEIPEAKNVRLNKENPLMSVGGLESVRTSDQSAIEQARAIHTNKSGMSIHNSGFSDPPSGRSRKGNNDGTGHFGSAKNSSSAPLFQISAKVRYELSDLIALKDSCREMPPQLAEVNFNVMKGARRLSNSSGGNIRGVQGSQSNVRGGAREWGRGHHQGKNVGSIQPSDEFSSLHRAENAWKPNMETDELTTAVRETNSVLNKLTSEMFDELVQVMLQLKITTTEIQQGIMKAIFDKALAEPSFCDVYAKLCVSICEHRKGKLPERVKTFSKDDKLFYWTTGTAGNESVAFNNENDAKKEMTTANDFKRMLIKHCQAEFLKSRTVDISKEVEAKNELETAEADSSIDASKLSELRLKLRDAEFDVSKMKQLRMGNMKFLGELYKMKIVLDNPVHTCIDALLPDNPLKKDLDDDSLEQVVKLLTTIGKELDESVPPKNSKDSKNRKDSDNRSRIGIYMGRLKSIASSSKVEMRTKFLILGLLDLRKKGWKLGDEKRSFASPTPKDLDSDSKDKNSAYNSQRNRGQNSNLNRLGNPNSSSRIVNSLNVSIGKGISTGGSGYKIGVDSGNSTRNPVVDPFLRHNNTNANRHSTDTRQPIPTSTGISRGGLSGFQKPYRPPALVAKNSPLPPSGQKDVVSKKDLENLAKKLFPNESINEEDLPAVDKLLQDYFANGPGSVDVFLNKAVYFIAEKKPIGRKEVFVVVLRAFKNNYLTTDAIESGISKELEFVEDLELDAPLIIDFLADFIGKLITEKMIPVASIKKLVDPLANKSLRLARKLIFKIFKEAGDSNKTKELLLSQKTALCLQTLLHAESNDEVINLMKEKELDWLL